MTLQSRRQSFSRRDFSAKTEMSNETAQQAAPAAAQNEQQATTPLDAVHFLDYWQILYSRKEIVIAVSILLILVGIVVTRRMPKVYAARSVIEVQREAPNKDLFGAVVFRYDPVFLRTQFEIMKSDPVIEQVVRESNLADDLGMAYGWKSTSSAQNNFERTVSLVKPKTSLSVFRDTDLIAITVKLDKPDKPDGEAARVAARVANTIAKVFREYMRNKSRSTIERSLEKLTDEVKNLEEQVTAKSEEIRAFREKNGIALLSRGDYGADTVQKQVAQYTQQAEDLQMQATVKKLRYDKIVELSPQDAAEALPALLGDNSLSQFVSDRQGLEMQLAALKQAGAGPNHPDVQKATALLAELDAKLKDRVDGVKNGLRIAWEQTQAEADLYKERLKKTADTEREISAGVAIELERLNQDLADLKQRRADLDRRMDDERIGLNIPKTAVEIIELAKVPEMPLPVSPNFALNVTLSVVAGLFFGIVLAFFVEYLDTTVKTAEDIERYMQSPVLGIVPQKIRSLNDPNARFSHYEVYRVLRMNLKNNKALGDGKILVITSASAGEGKSINAFNSAWVCAESGERVLLVDCDLYHPRQHKILDVGMEPGISNVVVGEASLDTAVIKTPQPNLDFLPAGRIAGASVFGLMDTEEMASLFHTLRERYDRVIVDAPPMIGVSDTAQLVRLADGVILIVQHRKYPRSLCRRAKDRVTAMGGNFIGAILNNVNAAHGGSSYYYENQYYYYYTSGASGTTRKRSHHHRHRSGYQSPTVGGYGAPVVGGYAAPTVGGDEDAGRAPDSGGGSAS